MTPGRSASRFMLRARTERAGQAGLRSVGRAGGGNLSARLLGVRPGLGEGDQATLFGRERTAQVFFQHSQQRGQTGVLEQGRPRLSGPMNDRASTLHGLRKSHIVLKDAGLRGKCIVLLNTPWLLAQPGRYRVGWSIFRSPAARPKVAAARSLRGNRGRFRYLLRVSASPW